MPERIYPTEDKLLAFLRTVVFNREARLVRRQGNKDGSVHKIGNATVNAYCAAVTFEWDYLRKRRLLDAAQYSSPNGSIVKGAVKNYRLSTHNRNKENRKDRLEGSYKDGLLSSGDYVKLFDYFWMRDTTSDADEVIETVHVRKAGRRNHVDLHFRNLRSWSMMLGARGYLSRGHLIREAELADLHYFTSQFAPLPTSQTLPDVETSISREFRAMSLVLTHGKVNKFGKLEQAGCIRAKDERMCFIGQLACFLFYLWEILGVEFPDFSNRDWYDLKLFPVIDNGTKAISDDAHRKQEKQAYTATNIRSTSVTHTGRKQVRALDGCDDSVKRKAGRWNQTSLGNSYESVVDNVALLVLAGFSKNDRPFLERDQVVPPEELSQLVFPEVDGWLERISGLDGDGNSQPGEEVDDSMACHSFLLLLKWMRSIFLQDSVQLRQYCPNHPIWTHELFETEAYKVFSEQLASVKESVSNPNYRRLDDVVPHISSALQDLRVFCNSRFSENGSHITKMQSTVDSGFQAVANAINDLSRYMGSDPHIIYSSTEQRATTFSY